MTTDKTQPESVKSEETAHEEPQVFAVSGEVNQPKFTRRQFMEFTAAATAAAGLAACDEFGNPLPLATPRPTDTPTSPGAPTATATNTPESPLSVVVKRANINLSSGPGETGYTRVVTLSEGEGLEVIARNQDGSWFEVKTSADLVGWIRADLVAFTFVIEIIPIESNIPAPSAPTSTPERRTTPRPTQPTSTPRRTTPRPRPTTHYWYPN